MLTAQVPSVSAAYYGSNPVVTRRVLKHLESKGDVGKVAAQLFRAQKASSRAKQYRGGLRNVSYRDLSYDRKDEAIEKLTQVLDSSLIIFGWGIDPNGYVSNVLYVDLPQGQVSFHSMTRYSGPDYPGEWDRRHASESRIISFCQSIAENDLSGFQQNRAQTG